MPLYLSFPNAYLCGEWAIAYEVDAPNSLLIEALGQTFYRP